MSNKIIYNLWPQISFAQLLTILFIALKLTEQISWSWWWVLCPLWIPVALFVVSFIFSFIAIIFIAILAAIFESLSNDKL